MAEQGGEETFLTREGAAQHLTRRLGRPISTRVLKRWATKSGGPRCAVIAGRATYRLSDLDQWLDDQFEAPGGSRPD